MGRDDDEDGLVSTQAEFSGGEGHHRRKYSRKRSYSSSRRRGRSPLSVEDGSSRGGPRSSRYHSSSSRRHRSNRRSSHRSRRHRHSSKYKKERSASSAEKEEEEYSDRNESGRRHNSSQDRRRRRRRRQSCSDEGAGGKSSVATAASSDYGSSPTNSPSFRGRRHDRRSRRKQRSSSPSEHRSRRDRHHHHRRRRSPSRSSISSEEQIQPPRRRKRQRKQHNRHHPNRYRDDDDYSKSTRSSRRRHSRRRYSSQQRSKRYHDDDRHDDIDTDCSWSSHDSRHRRRRRRRRSSTDHHHSKRNPKKRQSSASSPLSYQKHHPQQHHQQITQAPQPVSEDEASHHHNHDSSSKDVDDSYGHFEGGPGTVISSQYKLVRDVGLGTFGRVVEARDIKNNNSKVAIKIVRNVKRYHESAWIEADIVQNVNSRGGPGRSLVSILHDRFDWKGHACLVFECLGPSLYDFLKMQDYRPFPLYCIRHFATQLLHALDFIHSFGLIHTDLKPENILLTNDKQITYRNWDNTLQQVPASTNIKVIDFGGSTYDYEKKSSVINTRQYRAPEVILGLGWSMPSDLWSAGCIIAELYMGELLFATHDNTEHLALMERAIGRFPLDVLAKARHNSKNNSNNNQTQTAPYPHTYFDSYGWHKMNAVLSPSSLSHVRKMGPLESLIADHDKPSGLTILLRSLLTIDPNFRGTAKHILQTCSFCSPT